MPIVAAILLVGLGIPFAVAMAGQISNPFKLDWSATGKPIRNESFKTEDLVKARITELKLLALPGFRFIVRKNGKLVYDSTGGKDDYDVEKASIEKVSGQDPDMK